MRALSWCVGVAVCASILAALFVGHAEAGKIGGGGIGADGIPSTIPQSVSVTGDITFSGNDLTASGTGQTLNIVSATSAATATSSVAAFTFAPSATLDANDLVANFLAVGGGSSLFKFDLEGDTTIAGQVNLVAEKKICFDGAANCFGALKGDVNGVVSLTSGSFSIGPNDFVQTTNAAEMSNNGSSLGFYVNDAEGLCVGNGTNNQSIPAECDGTVTANTFSTVAGTSTGLAFAGGTLNLTSTGVGNVGAGTDDLITYSLPANALTASGRGLRIRAWGITANNGNAKTVTLDFGSQVVMTQALTTSIAGTWRIDAIIARTGASTQDVFAELLQLATIVHKQTITAGTQTETGAITIKCTGTATSNNDIVNEGLLVEFL